MGNSTYLATKPRYEILDGLRGIAAILVVAFHILEPYSSSPDGMILAHGYLAVDFSLCFRDLLSVTLMTTSGARCLSKTSSRDESYTFTLWLYRVAY